MRLAKGRGFVALAVASALGAGGALAQERSDNLTPAPNRRSDEGKGPFKTLVVRGAMLIDGTGGPPRGPVDIVVENNRIKEIKSAGTPGLALKADREPKADHEIDATGHYVLPGFVDLHVHAGAKPKNAEAEYAYKLWLAHGVTSVRGVPLTDQALSVKEKERSARNEIAAMSATVSAKMLSRMRRTCSSRKRSACIRSRGWTRTRNSSRSARPSTSRIAAKPVRTSSITPRAISFGSRSVACSSSERMRRITGRATSSPLKYGS